MKSYLSCLKKWIPLFIFTLLSHYPLDGYPSFDRDNQLWLSVKLKATMTEKFSIGFRNELRLGDDITDPYHCHGEIYLQYALAKILSAGILYRQQFDFLKYYYDHNQKKKAWDAQYKPVVFFNILLNPPAIVFHETARIEYGFFDNETPPKLQFRNISVIGYIYQDRVKVKRMALFYLKVVQVFFLHPEQILKLNRVSTGIMLPIAKKLKVDICYTWERKRRQKTFYDAFILGLGMIINVR